MPRLIPRPHMLKSVRSRNWNLSGAIEELVDNSLGHGKAREVTVHISNAKGIAVIDNGIGIDDINVSPPVAPKSRGEPPCAIRGGPGNPRRPPRG